MPIGLLASQQSPFEGSPMKACCDIWVVSYVEIVVQVDESVMNNGIVKAQGNQSEQQTEDDGTFARRRE